jgi:hypothetical protein
MLPAHLANQLMHGLRNCRQEAKRMVRVALKKQSTWQQEQQAGSGYLSAPGVHTVKAQTLVSRDKGRARSGWQV